MSLVNLREVDEVLLALQETKNILRTEHVASEIEENCRYCFLLHIVERGLAAYEARGPAMQVTTGSCSVCDGPSRQLLNGRCVECIGKP